MDNLQTTIIHERTKQMAIKLTYNELRISLDEINHYLDKKPRRFRKYGLHPLMRFQTRKGIIQLNDIERLRIMQKCLRNELERRNHLCY